MKETLAKFPLFAGLTAGDVEELFRYAATREVKKGDAVFHESEAASYLHVALKGKIKLVKHTSLGKDVIIDILTVGEALALEPLFDGKGYPASAIAVDDCTVVSFDKSRFLQFTELRPVLLRSALKELARRSREQTRQIRELSVGKVDSRIANLILRLGDKIGSLMGQDRVRIDIHLSRQDIADFTGTTVETAIRTMSRFARDGVVKTNKDLIVIENRGRLEELAEVG